MAKPNEPYQTVLVESYRPANKSGLHCEVRVRPLPGQGFPTSLHVECSKYMRLKYPVGTVFRLKAKLTDRKGEGEFLYSHYSWAYEVVKLGKKK